MPPDRVSPQNPDLSFDALYAQAQEARPFLEKIGNQMLSDMRAKYPGKFDSAYLQMGDIKDKGRAQDKITEYGGDHARVTDLARGRIVVETPEQARLLQQHIAERATDLHIQTMKDRFSTPSDTNYRDVLTTMKMDNGHVAEFRIEHKDMVVAGKLTHEPYQQLQEIERRFAAEKRPPTEAETRQIKELSDKIRDTHQAAVEKANLDPMLNDKGREKVTGFEAERITPRSNGYFADEDVTGSISKKTQPSFQIKETGDTPLPGQKAPPVVEPVSTQPASTKTTGTTARVNGAIGIGAITVNTADAILKGDPKKLAEIAGTTVAVTGAARVAGLMFGIKAVPVVGQVIGAGFAANDSYNSFKNGNATRGTITGIETTLYGIAAGAGIATVADCWNPTVIAPAAVALVAGGAALTITAAKTVYDGWNTIRGWFSSSANDHQKPQQQSSATPGSHLSEAVPHASSERPRLAELKTGTTDVSPKPNAADRPDAAIGVVASLMSRQQPRTAAPAF